MFIFCVFVTLFSMFSGLSFSIELNVYELNVYEEGSGANEDVFANLSCHTMYGNACISGACYCISHMMVMAYHI